MGGQRGAFKFYLYYNEIPHNTSYNAITPYAGAGSNALSYGGPGTPSSDTSTWLPFDYSTKRKDYGAGMKVNVVKPFYVDLSVAQEKKTGTRPSGAEGASSFGNAIELPSPVDYTTNSAKAEIGYAKQPFFGSFQYFYSQFKNGNENLSFRNPFLSTQPNVDTLSLEPDNTFHKGAFTGNAKLPFNSKFNTNLSYAWAKSDTNLLPNIFDGGASTPVSLSSYRFNGDVRTQNYDFVLTSNPISFLEGKMFYKYYKRENKSDIITALNPDGSVMQNQLFDYKKQSFGADLDFKLHKTLHLITSYKHVDLDRNRDDIPRDRDNIYSAELRWNPWKMGVFRVGYEKLKRTADHQVDPLADQVELWVRRYDAASKDRDTFKVSLALTPIDAFSFNIGYKYKKTSYPNTQLGLQRDETNAFNFDADYTFGKFARIFGYFDYDDRKSTQFQRSFSTDPNPLGSVQNASNYNWQSDQSDKTYDFGFALELYLIPDKLTMRVSGDILRSHGANDFTYFSNAALTGGRNNDNIDIGNYDSYKKEFYMLKFLYRLTKSTQLTAGYAYEKYTLSDAQYDGYQYTLGGVNTYLSGAYANPDYKANVVFCGVMHRF